MDVVAFGVRALLALVFTVAAAGKLVDRAGAKRALADFRVPRVLIAPIGWLLPIAELAVAAALLVTPSARAGAIGAAILLLAFMAGVGAAMARGEAPDCNCFGQIGSAPAGKSTLARNAVLVAVAGFAIAAGPGTDPGSWLGGRTQAEVVVLVLALLAVALGAAVANLVTAKRGLESDLAHATESLAAFPPGLPIGAVAPSFALPTATGSIISLNDLLARRRPLALLFVSPSCRPCRYMFSDLSRWQRTLSDRLTIALIASGTADEARGMSEEFGLHDVLFQEDPTVFRAYRASGTPSVVIVSPDGNIGSRVRASHGVVEALIRRAARDAVPVPDGAVEVGAGDGRDATPPLFEVQRWSGRGAQPV